MQLSQSSGNQVSCRPARYAVLRRQDKLLRKEGGETDAREQALAASQEDIARMVGAFCRSSVYAYQEEIKGGFITIRGGHRIGISGRAVAEGGKVINIGFFSGLNIVWPGNSPTAPMGA